MESSESVEVDCVNLSAAFSNNNGSSGTNRVCNSTIADANTTTKTEIVLLEPNLWCLALVLFPMTCIFGNVLVVLAVLIERSLKTSTNFLLVSLACADLFVGTLVMPFSVYLTINRLQWFLPVPVCNFFCVLDVSASTSSIVHLVAISVDRFYAVVRHMEYKSPKHKRRVYATILFGWVFSIGIGLPLGIGLNHGRDSESEHEHECGVVNPDYMFYSSIFAFYIPCLVMTIMYSFVFYKLHRRMRAVKLQEMAAGQMVQFGDNLGNILQHAYGNKENLRQASIIWAIPFLKTLEATIAENEDMSTEELDELTTILHTLESDPHHRSVIMQTMEDIPESPEISGGQRSPNPVPMDSGISHLLSPRHPRNNRRTSRLTTMLYSMTGGRRRRKKKRFRRQNKQSNAASSSGLAAILAAATKAVNNSSINNSDGETTTTTSSDFSAGGSGRSNSDSERRRRQSLYIAKQKIKTLKDRAIELLMKLKSKQGMAIRKETRATKLVSTVMLVFLLCWTPFFTLNIIKVFKLRTGTWTYELESLFIFFTWLGHLNSCLNPVIYSLFNRKFRATFKKLLHCPTDDASSPLQRQRRLYSRPFTGDPPEHKKSWLFLSHRHSSSPRKTGLQQHRFSSDRTNLTTTPRNGVLVNTLSLPPQDISPMTTNNLNAAELVLMKQRKITWQQTATESPTVVGDSKREQREIEIVDLPILSQEDLIRSQEHQQNGTDMALLRRVQTSRCSQQTDDQTLDFTEPVEV